MQIPPKDRTTPRQSNMSMTRKRKRRERRLIVLLALLAILSGLLVAYALFAYPLDSQITGEEQGTQEVHTTSQIPDNITITVETVPDTTAQPEIKEEPPYTEDELYCMAVVIYNEAGSDYCSDELRELVGYVVLNRVNDPRYPGTIRGVLEQPGQYKGLGSKGVYFPERSFKEGEAHAVIRAYEAARKVLENRNDIPIPENVVFQAEFRQGTGTYKQIGRMYFCYAEEVR